MEYTVRATNLTGLDEFTRAYLECAEWAGVDSEQEEALELGVSPKWDDRSIAQAKEECAAFVGAHLADIGDRLSQAGHDFYLTRNGHGAGFWDGDWPEDAGERMTVGSKPYGSANVWFDEETETLSFS